MDLFKLLAVAVAAALWSAFLAVFLRQQGVRPLRRVIDGFSRLGWLRRVGVLLLVVQLTLFGGAKHGGTDGGALAQTLMMRVPASSEAGSVSTVAADDVLRGYRLVSVVTNAPADYAMPEGASVRGTWHLTGAYQDVRKVALDGFAFPLGSSLCTSMWAFTWGKVRPRLGNASNEIAAVGAPMSALPGVSRFWTATTTNGTYLLTWEDFALGRVAIGDYANRKLVSAQIELRRDGGFVARSNEVERTYARVIAPNPVGPGNPEDPDNPLLPLHPYGPVQDLSVVGETNAYCWVDVVVGDADAWVRFAGDGASNLADPSFAARAGATNRVVLLIGKTYKVTCDLPFAVVGRSDPAINEWRDGDGALWLNWPVDIRAVEDGEETPLTMTASVFGLNAPRGFTMQVVPDRLGGSFVWTNGCCTVSGDGTRFAYDCGATCPCGGCCANGFYRYEGYRLGCSGGGCGCSGYDDDPPGEDDPEDPEPAPVVSVGFARGAVIFEDAYTNMPGQVVPWRSTTTKLTCTVRGGMKGGTATFAFANREKLVGPDLPESVAVPAGHRKTYELVYRGRLPSDGEEDIVVVGEFREHGAGAGGEPLVAEAKLTSVKVELEAVDKPLDYSCAHRHIFGVHEWVNYRHYPSRADVAFELLWAEQELIVTANRFFCPWSGGTYFVRFHFEGVELETEIDVCEPEVVCREVWWNQIGVAGQSGLIDMRLALYVEPIYVSFKDLYMEEIPDDEVCPRNGYFNTGSLAKTGALSHSMAAGAGVWSAVKHDSSWTADRACRVTPYPQPWSSGMKEWRIPVGWGDYNGNIKGRITPNPTTQLFTIDSAGTATIRKYNHEIRRTINNDVWLDGVLQDN